MLAIRISANDERIIAKAVSQAELEGAVQLVKDRIAQAKQLKQFGKTAKSDEPKFGWKEALAIVTEVLGRENVTKPPFPDYRWFQRINGVIRNYGMDEASVRSLAEYAKNNLRQPTNFDFLICQHRRVLDGEFNNKQVRKNTETASNSTTYYIEEA